MPPRLDVAAGAGVHLAPLVSAAALLGRTRDDNEHQERLCDAGRAAPEQHRKEQDRGWETGVVRVGGILNVDACAAKLEMPEPLISGSIPGLR